MEMRNEEMEMTRNCFNVRQSYEKLKKTGKHFTFEDVETSGRALNVPCIILSANETPFYTKTRHTPYYMVKLMDLKGQVITRRFDTPLFGMTEGVLQVYPDSKRTFISKEVPQSIGVSFGESSRNEVETKQESLPEYHKSEKTNEGRDFFQQTEHIIEEAEELA